ncbi:hypothetical protein J4G43_035850 [Bradyrhizobium barranii subsp. barranii]|uniref:Uncharacterized protein n=1 Tax=Bradyrhizobium barranii subsp. barranii TaxID=2823807 RepID=A0A939MB41_9BRAD|nr:hypothetical protein [Bradyrhizobium barranii]UEM10033.1 hypothetical protein J4G43_035850 [Bradyrhizobium barranii subsp. barranii]
MGAARLVQCVGEGANAGVRPTGLASDIERAILASSSCSNRISRSASGARLNHAISSQARISEILVLPR